MSLPSHPLYPLPDLLMNFLPELCSWECCRPHSCQSDGTRWFPGSCRRRADRAPCTLCFSWKSWYWLWRTKKLCIASWRCPGWPDRRDCSLLLRCGQQSRRSCFSCLSCTSGWALPVKRGCFLGLGTVQGWWLLGDSWIWRLGMYLFWTGLQGSLFLSWLFKYNYIGLLLLPLNSGKKPQNTTP